VLGDGVWDLLAARRARMLSIGVLSGGCGEDELTRADAFRVYRDAEELHGSLGELGVIP
jgi:phosphoglycolate phosphatase-like HAD superfamily hydrolase